MNDNLQAVNESAENDAVLSDDANEEDEDVADFESVAEDVSIHSVELYFETEHVTNDDTVSFADELLRRRQVFDSARNPDLPDNFTFRDAPPISSMGDNSTFHLLNSVPDHPLSAFFRTPFQISASEIFATLASDGFKPEHIKCLQRKPTGKVLITSRPNKCDQFLSTLLFY